MGRTHSLMFSPQVYLVSNVEIFFRHAKALKAKKIFNIWKLDKGIGPDRASKFGGRGLDASRYFAEYINDSKFRVQKIS